MTDRATAARIKTEDRPRSPQFESFALDCLLAGLRVRFQARGASMSPTIRDGEMVYVRPASEVRLRRGDIILIKSDYGFRLHRLVSVDSRHDVFITRGDRGAHNDPPVRRDQILGVVVAKDVRVGATFVRAPFQGLPGRFLRAAARGQAVLCKLSALTSGGRRYASRPMRQRATKSLGALALGLALLASHAHAQVAVDSNPSTSASADLTGPGTKTLSFNHTTSTTSNRALLVGVSMNIANSPTAAVSGITYNGSALTLVGAQNDSSNTRRVEQWYLLNPASGTNTIVVSVNVPASAAIGVVAGATVFTDVDQTVPLGTFTSATGEASGCVASSATGNYQCNSGVTVPNVVNGMVFDTLAVGYGTITTESPQVQQWNVTSGTPIASEDIVGTASARTGAPSVPVAEYFNNALTITSVANAAGGNTVYTGTITGGSNNGYVGDSFVVAGLNNANNGTFTATASTATTLTLNNTAGKAQTHNGTATTNGTFNWAQGAIGINPSAADIGVSVSVGSAVFLGQNTTFTITVYNNGTSAANNVMLSDTWPTTNMTTVSVTPSSGTTCTPNTPPITPPISCTLPTPFASGATATVTVVVTASVSGSYANTATVTDSGTPPDPNTGNNTYTAVATVQSAACANVSQAQPASSPLTGLVNTYYPGTASVAAGATSITLGAATGGPSGTPAAIAAGNLLLVIQMQDASINVSDTVTYGNNSTGQGFTALNSTGDFEFVTATNSVPVTGGTLNFTGAGGGGGLVLGYDASAANGTKGQSTFQVILVPQYTTATLATTGLTAEAWNGSTGGVLALDTSSTLTLNNATVVMDGMGFRGAAGLQLSGTPATPPPILPTSSDFLQWAPPTYTPAGSTGNGQAGWDGPKGEGIAGTPAWLEENVSGTLEPVFTGTGYPSGSYGQFNLTSVASASGGDTVYTGTITGGGNNAWAGYLFVVSGFSNPANNGWFASTASTATTLTLANANGVAQTGTATANLDGSMARGAPGNAGGGGTDGDPETETQAGNDQNDGGGGGGNGGAGGFGGDTWSTNLSGGGEGGAAFPATVNRVVMGGGGGGGTRNNSNLDTQASSGSAGGGIIIIRTYALSGSATLTANGVNAYNNTANDGGGGAGAGGSIVVLSANGGESGLTLQANGGVGGDAWGAEPFTIGNRHGPGGGGGGGVLIVSGPPAGVSVNGGANGTTETPGVPYGSTPGAAGISVTNASITQTSGTQSGAECTPDMTVAKSHSGSFVRGTSGSYTLTATNISPYGPTSGTVTVNDTLPVGLAPTSASGTGWTCSVASQTVSCTDSSVLAGNSSYPPITVNVNVLPTAPSSVTNIAVVGGGGEVNTSNDTGSNTSSVLSSADLSLTNVAVPNPIGAGSNITYTQVVSNNGPSAADNATLVETIPANTTLVSISAPSGWTCSSPGDGGTGTFACTALSIAANTSASFSMIVKVNTGTANGTVITDTATVSSSVTDPNIGNNTASASTVVGTPTTSGELSVTNMVSPNPVAAGGNITYTQAVTNGGSAAVTGATFSEPTPTATPATTLTFVSLTSPSGWACTAPPVSCTNPSVPAGYSGTFTVVYTVSASASNGTTITDTATVTPSTACGPCSATATTTVAPSTQVTLTLNAVGSPSTVFPGNNITYTQTVTNNGPAAATGVQFTQAIPANTTYVSVSAPAGWTCTVTTSVTCTDSNSMAASTSADIIVVVNVAATVTAATITENSSVLATGVSSVSGPTITTDVVPTCNLAVTNSGTPSPVTAGSNITYTQVVTNSGGPSNCANATFTEAFPNNTTFVSLTPVPSGWTCTTTGSVSCTNPSVAPNSTSTFTLVVTVSASTAAGTVITDTANVGTSSHDTSPNTSATVQIGVTNSSDADLSVTDSGSPNPVTAGQNITFSQTVNNAGPASATTVKLSETVPTGTTFVSLTGPGGSWTCTNTAPYSCSIATLAPSTPASFTFVVSVPTTAAFGSAITDTASVASTGTTDPNPNNNTASATVYVAPSANLSVTNSATPVPVLAGNNITYTQAVTNGGPSAATNAVFTGNTPPNTNFQSITIPSGWACSYPTVGGTGTITCTNSSFASGTASFTVVLQVNSGTASGTAINDTVTISSSTANPNSANNSATASDVVALATQADLVATNSASPVSVAAGSNVTYTQSVTNDGPSAATSPVTFTQTTPPNTNFQSISPPPGWTCTNPGVGNAGTITCTDAGTLGLNSTANFTLVLQVNSSTPSGTYIGETVTASSGNIVPNLTTNSATATVVVANANSADMAIVKTASPSPTVFEGDTLTYSLAVTNNGPATATDVTVVDTLPSAVTYLSSSTTAGTCSEADGTVTCLLGTMADTGTATITIVTLASAPGTATNTATVSADQTDPNPGNNTSTQTETITYPTKIQLQSFSARMIQDKTGANRVALIWKTGGEAHNLGFNVYREKNGQRVRLNPSLIAGSALRMRGALPRHSGKTYAWIDSAGTDSTSNDSSAPAGGAYWLEDVDIGGKRTLHGPVSVEASTSLSSSADATSEPSLLLNQLNQSQPAAPSNEGSHPVESSLREFGANSSQREKQFQLAAHPAVKIYVKHEGWYSVTQPELVQSGLDLNVDPALLHLYAEAVEQPIKITGAKPGAGGFGPQASLQFYGTGIDTPYSGTRVYWLVAEHSPGLRIPTLPPSTGSNQPPQDFLLTVELTPHTTYFPALITRDGNNFFGPIVSSTPLDQTIEVPHLDPTSAQAAKLDVILQGIILGIPHNVTVALNGTALGNMTFTGQSKGRFSMSLPPGALLDGTNTITLTAQGGEYDTSLIQSIQITYPHFYIANSGTLKFTGLSGDEIQLTGFAGAPAVVLDITNPDQPVQLTPQVTPVSTSNPTQEALEFQVPWSTGNTALTQHTLLAVATDHLARVAGIRPNHSSHWHSPQAGSAIAMISYEAFASALSPLVSAHAAQGQSSTVISVDDLYDEFTFGEHNPYAIRDFLQTVGQAWRTPPHYLLLNGRASDDPRNYLGYGHLDFVPTKIVPTTNLMTASDDWFSDFDNTGMPTVATGRFPVSTLEEANLVVGKVAAYEGQSTNGPWTSQALIVADVNDTENFTQDSLTVQAQLPSSLQVTDVFATNLSIPTAQQDIITSINAGQLLVNYAGHGSEDQWSGEDLFNNTTADALTNGSSLPVFLIMDCLNGLFQDVVEEPLAVTLMLAPNGGAVAVLGSSGLDQPAPQTTLDTLVVQNALHAPYPALGDAILKAKSAITDLDTRETYNLLGDPAMPIKSPAQNSLMK